MTKQPTLRADLVFLAATAGFTLTEDGLVDDAAKGEVVFSGSDREIEVYCYGALHILRDRPQASLR